MCIKIYGNSNKLRQLYMIKENAVFYLDFSSISPNASKKAKIEIFREKSAENNKVALNSFAEAGENVSQQDFFAILEEASANVQKTFAISFLSSSFCAELYNLNKKLDFSL